MEINISTSILESYANWLTVQKYQSNTIRNYLLDLKLFFEKSNNTLSSAALTNFITNDSTQNNHLRHLASISKFCQFCADQQITGTNLFSLAKKHSLSPSPTRDLDLLLSQFSQNLSREHKSPITIKSYLGDIRQYISFCESQTL